MILLKTVILSIVALICGIYVGAYLKAPDENGNCLVNRLYTKLKRRIK